MHECMGMYIIQAVVQGIQEHTEYLECVYTNGKKNAVLPVLWLSDVQILAQEWPF